MDIEVHTPRTASQEEALVAATNFLEQIFKLPENADGVDEELTGVLNACDPEQANSGAVNLKFQSLLLACAAEDQKRLRKKIQNWMHVAHTTRKIFT